MEFNLLYDTLHTADGYIEVETYNGVISVGAYNRGHQPATLRLTIEQVKDLSQLLLDAADRVTRDQE